VPNVSVVHDRVSLEVMRGCVRGCRFCQAGYIYRPLRERDPRSVAPAIERLVDEGGYDEVSLLSLSTGDYSCVNPVLRDLMDRLAERKVAVSLPSTRVDALSPHILEEIRRVRKTGFTLAPEAGTQRLRDVIQKEYSEEELVEAARLLFSLGWQSVKLYFMLGLPTETEEDLLGIVELCRKVARAGGGRRQVTASVSTFIPKPHTPFQWAPQLPLDEVVARQSLLRRELAKARIRFKWHDARLYLLEGVFARGDRRLSSALLEAYRLGCRFDGWTEECRFDLWREAFERCRVDAAFYLRRRPLDEALPWDHLRSGVTKEFLRRELARAMARTRTPDCSVERCTYCGACDFKTIRNITYHPSGAKGSEHRGGAAAVSSWATSLMPADRPWGSQQWLAVRGDGDGTPLGADRPPPDDGRGAGAAQQWLSGDPNTIAMTGGGGGERQGPAVRIRLHYAKEGPARFIGMRDLVTLWARSCRRAGLPLAYTQGHHPLSRIDFGPALAFGVESRAEFCDLDLRVELSPQAVLRALNRELPEGMRVIAAGLVEPGSASLGAAIRGFVYRVALSSLPAAAGWRREEVRRRLARFHEDRPFLVRKRAKGGKTTVDAKRFVAGLWLGEDTDALFLETRVRPEGTLGPYDLVAGVFELGPQEAKELRVTKIETLFGEHPALSSSTRAGTVEVSRPSAGAL
jgi:radical SAM-linked protein